MKYIWVAVALLCLWGCKKDGGNTAKQPFTYGLSGLPDTIYAEQLDTVETALMADLLSGDAAQLSLQVSGLPNAVGASFSPMVAMPPFAVNFRIVTQYADTGNYVLTLSASDSKSSVESKVVLRVVPNPVNPSLFLTGHYREQGPCVLGAVDDTVNITEEKPFFNKLRLSGLWHGNPTNSIVADIDPENHSLMIPPQVVNGVTFTGEGTINGTQIDIRYKVSLSFSEDSCSVQLTKF